MRTFEDMKGWTLSHDHEEGEPCEPPREMLLVGHPYRGAITTVMLGCRYRRTLRGRAADWLWGLTAVPVAKPPR